MIMDPWFYVAAVPAVFLVGMSKGGFGGTLALLGVPLMALAISPVAAAGILLPIMIVMDAIALLAWRGTVSRAVLLQMLPASMVGIALGYATSAVFPPDAIRVVIGLLSLWFVANWWFRLRGAETEAPQHRGRAAFWGACAGYGSFVAHAGGPPFQVYVAPLRLPPAHYAGTAVVFFAATNAVKLVPYYLLGQFSDENLATSLMLLPLAPVATLFGVWIARRLKPELFYRIVYAFLVPVGIKLVHDGTWGLISP
ncbi:sulfite exporter TauE/SafE family protein [Fulvimarina sp. 2208YS6-2-32]|uniref:Probable membrane transporter protein n=1 Tax=Fulvimarina uroteuthidis TaxID=3098149 RepID=A0ABU5I216_9HYPH|nr:sulfite exporter TauE/SafE family protein [Fulvimarina sp. 2208YS6-2-32]MDY8109410.1 sulfite exporter TauE/SafE family protein [Fulvimarina sp. 2208YS6-2-32]